MVPASPVNQPLPLGLAMARGDQVGQFAGVRIPAGLADTGGTDRQRATRSLGPAAGEPQPTSSPRPGSHRLRDLVGP
jgi:hypothetical protein